MNTILLTVLALTGADVGGASAYGVAAGSGYGEPCDVCDVCASGHGHHHRQHDGIIGSYLGPMPQSCYNPSFGCYPSTRFMHRYPAFHNYYYRAAYNYRHYFDYPWHAGLHEPTSMFSYHVPPEAGGQTIPTPVPDAASRRGSAGSQTANGLHSITVPPRTLR
jgi:hypothetical protein